MTLKLKLMSLLALGIFSMSACEDPIVTDPICGTREPKNPVIIDEDPCGEKNGIAPGGCIRYEDEFTVALLPLQCEGGNSDEKGLKKDGKYYKVRCDRSGQFGSYRVGETIRIEYWFTDDCIFTAACSTPWADGCIAISNVVDYTK